MSHDENDERPRLRVVVHDDGEAVVSDERGAPVLCKDCRFSGWFRMIDFTSSQKLIAKQEILPTHCLYHSGGANPVDGRRVIFPEITTNWEVQPHPSWTKVYPACTRANETGLCTKFVQATKPRWWQWRLRWFADPLKMRP